MVRLHLRSKSPGQFCRRELAGVLARTETGGHLMVQTDSRDDAEALAETLRDQGVIGISVAGSMLEIRPELLH
jgi:hypothetical protein